MTKKKERYRLTVIFGGKQKQTTTDSELSTLDGVCLSAECWVYQAGAEYARVDIWNDGLKDWGCYAEYEA